MSDLGLNKIMAAAFSTGLAILGLNAASDAFFEHDGPEQPGYLVEVAATDAGHGDDEPKWIPPTDYGVLLAEADIAKGQKKVAACASCHNFEPNGPNGTGPGLYDVVMRDKASHGGFGYSDALTSLGGQWDYASLDGFLKNPKKYASGTAMNYAGLSKETDRMNVIAYLHSLSASPAPLPAPLPPEAFIEPTSGEEAHGDVVDAAHETAEDAGHAVDAAHEEVENVSADAEAGVDALTDAAEGAQSDVADAVEEATETASDTASSIVDDVTEAVESATDEVEEAAEEVGEEVDTEHGPHN